MKDYDLYLTTEGTRVPKWAVKDERKDKVIGRLIYPEEVIVVCVRGDRLRSRHTMKPDWNEEGRSKRRVLLCCCKKLQ